tara:strand:+ start:28933 stop:29730 length:798 start_codon:yes stop_codon:yes gene_type:complete
VLELFIIMLSLLLVIRHRYYWQARGNIIFKNDSRPVMMAHRGSMVMAPGNTIEAFMDAIDYGFKYIEMDVCQLKDGTVVCSHNFDLERETNGNGWLYDKNISDLKQIRTGDRSHPENMQPIPRLTDVLEKLPDHIFINIEIKCKSLIDFTIAKTIGKMSRSGTIPHPHIISCFNPFVVVYMRIFHPELYVGYIVDDYRFGILTNWIHPDFLHIDASLADDEMIKEWKKHKLGITMWTVNSKPAVNWCVERDVLCVITDNHKMGNL